MLWLALHLPQLSLEACCATLPAAAAARPVVLIAGHRVQAANAAAAAAGIRPGIQRATALALAAELLIVEGDAARDAAALQAVAHASLAFTPAVTLQDGQTVLLEVQASLRLYGGLAALRQRLAGALAPLGHRVEMAAAPTALGAALLARWPPAAGRGAGDPVLGPHATRLPALQRLLDEAPVALLGPGRDHGEALQGMGLHTLSDLRRMPRAGLARRFGAGLLDELDRALGQQADPRRWLEPPAVFDSQLELLARADSAEQVLHGAAVLLARLVAWAQARQARVGGYTLRMLHERQRQTLAPATELRVDLAEPALDPAHLQGLLRERLGRCQLAAPTLELQLHCSHLVAGHAPNGELFPTHASQAEGLTRLLERLRARLGDGQVQRLLPVADHRPECASRSAPAWGSAAAPGAEAVAPAAASLQRPAWLLPEPLPLAERGALPLLDGRALQLVGGPERIEAGWWDGTPAARDYFIAQAGDGSLVWVYRGRLPAAPGEASWFLQGRFA
jgi:protein ImuB